MGSTILRMEELGQRYSAVISTGLYLKLNEYLSGQRGPLYRNVGIIVKGRTSFAFSDVRRLIAEAGLNEDFDRVCPKPGKPMKNSLVAVLLRMVA
jgi:hypothetical protein